MTALLPVPELAKPRTARKVSHTEATLDNGLRVVAVRRPSVPMVEVRLRIPFFGSKAAHLAQSSLLSDAILTGTEQLDRTELAIALGELGADLTVGLDADRLLLSASALSDRLADLLRLMGEVLTGATYPAEEFAGERERLIERITIARSQPGVIANEALGQRTTPGHPYGRSLPTVEEVGSVSAAQLRKLHAQRVVPAGAALVVVGDISPARVLAVAQRSLGGWSGDVPAVRTPKLPTLQTLPLLVVDRPGSVQTSLRLAGDALPRQDARYPALQLANLIFGGYFSSRWVENIREDKGYTYSPRSSIDHAVLGSSFLASADVATEVTAAAVLETLYELGRMASTSVTAAELESVRQYAIGTMALGTSTQAGLASTLTGLIGAGLEIDWLASHVASLQAVTIDDVAAVAAEFLAPRKLVGVAVGDAAKIVGPLAGIIDVE